MRYGQGLLDEILRRTDLVQLVAKRVKLARKGKVLWGCCPFHGEKSPSFKVENERRTYKCFGCGAGGDAFKWLMETEGLSFPEAVERLAFEAGVEVPKWSAEDEAREEKRKSLYDVAEAACVFFEAQLAAPGGKTARDYLTGRGLDAAAIARFRLGYAPQGHGALIAHLRGQNISLDDMIAAGLARPAEESRPARDFFYHRVMFPIADARGRVIAFGARALDAEAKPKYINTADTALFSKGHTLYNFAAARSAAIKSGSIVLAEGYMDVIALVRAGLEHAVAPLGTALTEDQLALLWRVAPEPVLAFDGDSAGLRAGSRAAQLALPHLKPGHSLRFAFLPEGEDPDTLISRDGPAAIRQVLEAAEPLIAVLWRGETEGKDLSTPERRAGLEQGLKDLTAKIADKSVAEHYRQAFRERLATVFQTPPREGRSNARRGDPRPGSRFAAAQPAYRREAVSEAVRRSPMARGPSAPGAPAASAKAALARPRAPLQSAAARRLQEADAMALLLECPDLVQIYAEALAALPAFADPMLDRLRHELLNVAASGTRLEKQRLGHHLARSGFAGIADHPELQRAAKRLGMPPGDQGEAADADDIEARWLVVADKLRRTGD